MCYCCCFTRTSKLIYMLVITVIFFIYGIYVIIQFGSKTQDYKNLKSIIDFYEQSNTEYNNSFSEKKIQKINRKTQYYDFSYGYGLIKNLKGIENGLEGLIFAFGTLFLIIEIIFIIFSCGDRQFQTLTPKLFNYFNIIRIICIILSSIFIFLNVLGAILLSITFRQYVFLAIEYSVEVALGIILGFLWCYYGIFVSIYLTTGFVSERRKFILVGSDENPGPEAKLKSNGNLISRNPPPVTGNIDSPQNNIQNQNQEVPIANSNNEFFNRN